MKDKNIVNSSVSYRQTTSNKMKVISFTLLLFIKSSRLEDTTETPSTMMTGDDKAILVTGGFHNGVQIEAVEALSQDGSYLCTLPSLPQSRSGHSQDGLLLCGGDEGDVLDSCVTLTDGEWITTHKLNKPRYWHTSWSTGDEIILMGGSSGESGTNSEILSSDSNVTTEGFQLKYNTWSACSITVDDDTLIMTGGSETLTTVTMYNREGFVKDLAPLQFGRIGHVCGLYLNNEGEKVYLVTGGNNGGDMLSSTEILVEGSDRWITAGNLPRAMCCMRSVSIDNTFIITGGWGDGSELSEVLMFDTTDNSWTLVGNLTQSRTYPGMSVVNTSEIIDHCLE